MQDVAGTLPYGLISFEHDDALAPTSIDSEVIMNSSRAFPIVGVGASAGGLEPLQKLLGSMPREPAMAFVIITHLNPEHVSMLPEILARTTWMDVRAARDGDRIEPGSVWVLAPNSVLTIEAEQLRSREPEPNRAERNPIDIFLASLAREQAERAVGIILSGGGSDGALGLKAIKEHGGFTFVQGSDHSAPRHSGMPTSAIATGMVDMVLPIDEIPGQLVHLARVTEGMEAEADAESDEERIAAAQKVICAIIQRQLGHDFGGYKASTFLRRIRRRQGLLRLQDLEAYQERLRKDPDEVNALFQDLLIHVTSFFRDQEAFEALAHCVRRLLDEKGPDDPLRVWVPGCSTGEEAYSLAILLQEEMGRAGVAPTVQLFATDIDAAAIDIARVGRYPAAMLEDRISTERLQRFFVAEGQTCRVKQEIRDLCVFSTHSLVRDPPFSRLDLISCRNLLIYLTSDLQRRLVPIFHYALRPGGYLFLGSAENISHHGNLFNTVDAKKRIFQRNDQTSTPVAFPVYLAGERLPSVGARGPHPIAAGNSARHLAETRVLERFAPAFVVIDEAGEVLHYSGRTGKYLEAPTGAPTRQLIPQARKDLRLELSSALAEARRTTAPVHRPNLHVQWDDRRQRFDLIIESIVAPDQSRVFVVVFDEVGSPLSEEQASGLQQSAANADDVTDHLEHELQETRDRLQSVIEEYETAIEELRSSNEELVSMNEELQSTTEELETAKEEQQSVNEELQTVNQELRDKIEQLARATDDMRNLFASAHIATLLLDQNLVIRSFTPDASTIFNLIDSDVGRHLPDFSHCLDYPELRDDLMHTATRGEPRERQVATVGDEGDPPSHYLVRLQPYRSESGKVDGVVASFVNVTRLVEAERHQRYLLAELNHRVKNMLTMVISLAMQTEASSDNSAQFLEVFQDRLHAMARTFELLSREHWGKIAFRELLEVTVAALPDGGHQAIQPHGPEVVLRPKAALALGMVLHELVTNAVKHGALSVPDGGVTVNWRTMAQNGQEVEIDWLEHGGPPVTDTVAEGFGTKLIQGEIAHTLRGQCELKFEPDGLHAHIAFPAAENLAGGDPSRRGDGPEAGKHKAKAAGHER